MKLARDLLLILIGAIIGNAIMSHAGGSMGAGVCRHTGLSDGVWYQDQFGGFKGNLNSSCFETQWNSDADSGVSLGFAHLGYLHGSNLATINDSTDDTKIFTGGSCVSGTGKNCLARFNVRAMEYGVTLGAFTKAGPVTLEGGVFVYRSEFTVNVHAFHGVDGYPYDQNYRIVAYHNTPYLGVMVKGEKLYGRLRVYQQIDQDGPQYPYKGATTGPVFAATMGAIF